MNMKECKIVEFATIASEAREFDVEDKTDDLVVWLEDEAFNCEEEACYHEEQASDLRSAKDRVKALAGNYSPEEAASIRKDVVELIDGYSHQTLDDDFLDDFDKLCEVLEGRQS